MTIIINNTQKVKDKFQNVFMTINNVDGDTVKFVHVAPMGLSGQNLQDFVDSKEDEYVCGILSDMYPDVPSEIKRNRQDFEQWIINESPEKIAWIGSHPDIFPTTGTEKDNFKAAIQDLVNTLTFSDIDNHIETVFSDHTTEQQNSLKKLYKTVLGLVKKAV
jgi:hypothetical protein